MIMYGSEKCEVGTDVYYKCRCGALIKMQNPGAAHSKQMKMHLVKSHGYSFNMSFRQEWKLLKNYFTDDPILVK